MIFDDELEKRNIINANYRKYLNNAQHHPKRISICSCFFSIVLGSNEKRNTLINRLQKNKIPSVVYYKFPIHLMKAFEYLGYKKKDFLFPKIYHKQLLVYQCILILPKIILQA